MKQIYLYDTATKAFTHTDLIAENTAVPEGATSVKPLDNNGNALLDPVWNGTSWVGLSPEAFAAKHKTNDLTGGRTPIPSSQDISITELTNQLMQTQKTTIQQGQQISSLTAALLAQIKQSKMEG